MGSSRIWLLRPHIKLGRDAMLPLSQASLVRGRSTLPQALIYPVCLTQDLPKVRLREEVVRGRVRVRATPSHHWLLSLDSLEMSPQLMLLLKGESSGCLGAAHLLKPPGDGQLRQASQKAPEATVTQQVGCEAVRSKEQC